VVDFDQLDAKLAGLGMRRLEPRRHRRHDKVEN